MLKLVLPGLFLLLGLVPDPSLGQVDPLLETALAGLAPGCPLEVTTLSGDRQLGFFAGVQAGDILLTRSEPTGVPLLAVPLAAIGRLREEAGAAGVGWRTGFTTGAVVGGSLSLLFGLALSSLDGDDGDDTMSILAFTGLGLAAGGVTFGLVGAGIGSMTTVWQTRYEAPGVLPASSAEESTMATLGLGLASTSADGNDFSAQGLVVQAGLRRSLGSRFSIGPELAYYDVGGTLRHEGPGYTSFESVGARASFGLAAGWERARRGWSPFLTAGTGYYIGDGEFLGLSLGGGLRYRTAGHQDIRLEVRKHLNIYEGRNDFRHDGLFTAGAIFAFGL